MKLQTQNISDLKQAVALVNKVRIDLLLTNKHDNHALIHVRDSLNNQIEHLIQLDKLTNEE
ncbi:hypothetical protein [Lactococcus fujiensis]|uniref:Uncharacterized protein n=1 Tax=Lactococcus fujiensis JCM 16395 TaxID=1291764 RepID=A0A2A5RJF4_9LACT|nr:hypothetical protein [Lactococcus fujiensis]PCR99232.1 hypothetical protein RT41_GL000423 [Lactococcus fujiensis JCM 16395]